MTIPTEEEFDKSVKLIESAHAEYLKPAFKVDYFSGEDSVVAKDLLTLAYHATDIAMHRVDEDKVYSWLMSQPAFVRVRDRMFPLVHRSSETDAEAHRHRMIQSRYDALHKFVSSSGFGPKGTDSRFYRRVDSILGISESSPRRWLLTVVLSLRQYHYLDTASKIVEERRQFFSKIKEGISGMEAMSALSRDNGVKLGFSAMQKSRNVIPLLDERFDDRLMLLRSLLVTDLDSIYPIARLDGTARERLFVTNMAHANRRATGKHRPSEIGALLEIEGFKNQMDDRSIERQCAAVHKRWRQLIGLS